MDKVAERNTTKSMEMEGFKKVLSRSLKDCFVHIFLFKNLNFKVNSLQVVVFPLPPSTPTNNIYMNYVIKIEEAIREMTGKIMIKRHIG